MVASLPQDSGASDKGWQNMRPPPFSQGAVAASGAKGAGLLAVEPQLGDSQACLCSVMQSCSTAFGLVVWAGLHAVLFEHRLDLACCSLSSDLTAVIARHCRAGRGFKG